MIKLEDYKKICASKGLVLTDVSVESDWFYGYAKDPFNDKPVAITYYQKSLEAKSASICVYMPTWLSRWSHFDDRRFNDDMTEEDFATALDNALTTLDKIKQVLDGQTITFKQLHELYVQYEASSSDTPIFMETSVRSLLQILKTNAGRYSLNKNNP